MINENDSHRRDTTGGFTMIDMTATNETLNIIIGGLVLAAIIWYIMED